MNNEPTENPLISSQSFKSLFPQVCQQWEVEIKDLSENFWKSEILSPNVVKEGNHFTKDICTRFTRQHSTSLKDLIFHYCNVFYVQVPHKAGNIPEVFITRWIWISSLAPDCRGLNVERVIGHTSLSKIVLWLVGRQEVTANHLVTTRRNFKHQPIISWQNEGISSMRESSNKTRAL